MSPKHDKESAVQRTAVHRTWPFAGSATQLRPLARRVHFLAGILVAPFLLLLCLTGLVYVFSPQIHDDLYSGQLFVHDVGGMQRPVAEQIRAALAAHPEGQLRSVVPPRDADRTTRVNLSVPSLDEPGEARTVFVDPYTNYINGELTTVDGRMPANVWLRHLHADLHLGAVGRLYSEIASSWLPVIVLGGLVLWIGKQGRRPRTAREVLVPIPRGKGEQARLRAVHGPLGIWLTVGLLVLGITGLTMSRFAGWGLPAVRAPELAMAPVAVPGSADPIGVDRVLQVARAEGLGGELELAVPTAPDRPFTVAETSPGLPIRKDSIAIDPYTGGVTERIRWDDYPILAQVRELGVQLHTGTLFGLANQILLALLMIATVVLIIGGYRMWWKRSPYQGQLPPVPPPALRQLTSSVGVPVVLATVVLGWLMPAFGISLAAFIVVDLVVGAVRERQERLRRTVTAGALLVAGSVLGTAVLVTAPSPVTRVDATDTYRGLGAPGGTAPDAGEAPLDQTPPPGLAVPAGASGTGIASPPPSRVRGAAPTGAAPTPPAPTGSSARTDGPDDPPAGGRSSGSRSGPGGGSDGSPGSEGPGPAESTSEVPDAPEDPVSDAPEPEPPSTEDSPEDEQTGLVGGLVGTLSQAARPVVDTVKSVAGGLLGG
jgi:uncharacterized iron-regulated membrane protein